MPPPTENFKTSGCLAVPAGAAIIDVANPTHMEGVVAHTLVTSSLFPHLPTKADVNQGAIANCFQLATINAVLSLPEGPYYIMNAMVAEGERHVVIRLWLEQAWRYYRVERSIFMRRSGGKPYSAGALWVNILEKAFLMLASARHDYGTLRGGDPLGVSKAFLGPEPATPESQSNRAEMILKATLSMVYRGNAGIQYTRTRAKALAEGLFSAEADAVAFEQWNTSQKGKQWEDLAPTAKKLSALAMHLAGLPDRIQVSIAVYAEANDAVVLDSQHGGRYTTGERRIYMEVTRALALQNAVTANTNLLLKTGTRSLAERMGLSTGTAGESRRNGLYANHAYTVLAGQSKWNFLGLVLRNPHGRNGRKYEMSGTTLTCKADDAGEFWMELHDFCTDFEFNVHAKVLAPARAAFQSGLAAQLAVARENVLLGLGSGGARARSRGVAAPPPGLVPVLPPAPPPVLMPVILPVAPPPAPPPAGGGRVVFHPRKPPVPRP